MCPLLGAYGVANGLLLRSTVAVMNHFLEGGVLGHSLGALGHTRHAWPAHRGGGLFRLLISHNEPHRHVTIMPHARKEMVRSSWHWHSCLRASRSAIWHIGWAELLFSTLSLMAVG